MSDQGEIARLTRLLRAVYEGPSWHGPAVLEVLDGVTAEQAAARPIPDAHSIWALTGHMTYWRMAAAGGLAGEWVDPDPPVERNFPVPAEPTPAAWDVVLRDLHESQTALLERLAVLAPARLDDLVEGRDHAVFTLIHGSIHHDLYHAGQIALLRKLV